MDLEELRGKLSRYFAASRPNVTAAYLFGSAARDEMKTSSDIDVAVLFTRAPARSLDSPRFQIQSELERELGLPVDVLVLNDASADLSHRVFRDGVLLLDRDPGFRIRFEVKRRNEYLDFLPVLRRYRRFPSSLSGT